MFAAHRACLRVLDQSLWQCVLLSCVQMGARQVMLSTSTYGWFAVVRPEQPPADQRLILTFPVLEYCPAAALCSWFSDIELPLGSEIFRARLDCSESQGPFCERNPFFRSAGCQSERPFFVFHQSSVFLAEFREGLRQPLVVTAERRLLPGDFVPQNVQSDGEEMMTLISKTVVATALVTAVLVGPFAEQSAACRTKRYVCTQRRTVHVSPAPTTVITKTEVVARVTVDPIPHLPEVPQGSAMRVKVNFLGNEAGVVFVTAGKLTLQCEILEWAPTHVVFQLPNVGVLDPSPVTIDVAKADGRIARSVDVLLTPTADIEIIESVEVVPRAPRRGSSLQPTLQTGGIPVVPGG